MHSEAYGNARTSAQRRVIAEAVLGMCGAFAIEDLVARVRETEPGIGTATVYRAVAAMAASGFVETVGARGTTTLYAHCPAGHHHHHLVCTGCGVTVECACPIDDSVLSAAEAAGFTLTGHDVTLYGHCASCAEER